MRYQTSLESCKLNYPFDYWFSLYQKGMGKYSEENCKRVRKIFDDLILCLQEVGENASEETKLFTFETAVESLNRIREERPYLIETNEREDFCELIDEIGIAAGLYVDSYADGQGIASLWRTW
ncbi:hypothetical protein [Pseudoalteromonas gelatinilytica]|uniref:Uncharacterized protein n=1 Tax=Pseudoalteromonas gelatinilytica TaxID=1703256 RepID=A0ABQ1THE1_9GAMM|nr:hypothetical protein [Pseudoalteromonas profundi]GGE95647.1 hypothetical protein GCM10008027_20790 [Pseudoalteromonas profundi]